MAQQTQGGAATGLQNSGQQAVAALLKQVVLDPTALVESTGKPLPANGNWSIGKNVPAACPQTTDGCFLILYRVPDQKVSCEWVVRLTGDGSSGIILDQNEDASRYLLRRLPTSQAAEILVTNKKPVYPPIAAAAHVSGQVIIKILVSPEGTVEKAFVVSGPEMLRTSSIDAAKGYIFKPLMAGTKAVPFETNVAFDFSSVGSAKGVTSRP
ncbi:energy transducer TonB [Tunturiibacter lichenicola]|uniref:energy transducer TonB n=1 Tax=Tunturiibacter lichenicola TaxID=2051959 RepID=UPI0021B1B7AF|nr:energy transducer TonB [Edaphobacter lichenicola]